MITNEIKIEIPKGKEIDWEESAKQQKIVFKNKISTYEEIEKIIYQECHNRAENIIAFGYEEQIEAKIKLANTCYVLNNGWNPKIDETGYYLYYNAQKDIILVANMKVKFHEGHFWFKSEELAKQAIEILGKETIVLAVYNIW